MTIQEYIKSITKRYKAGNATEHSYRGDLQALLQALAPQVEVTNEPQRTLCGAPDYILTRKGVPVGYLEAKDIGKSLDSKLYHEQFNRYRSALSNLIITDYLEFRLYLDGAFTTSVALAEIRGGTIVAKPEHFAAFTELIGQFSRYEGQTITSASKLSKMMAAKARLLAEVIEKALDGSVPSIASIRALPYSATGERGARSAYRGDEESGDRTLRSDESASRSAEGEAADNSLKEQLEGFKQILIHDITAQQFADIYAQTIAYGMFAARLHDRTLADFNRREAADLIPKTNPFLRKLFQYIAGYDLDSRMIWIVDALADLFKATDVALLLKDFGKATQQHDPIIHFYETFLAEYDPALRKSRGVWYTPEPVVNFMVRAVDDILKSEFSLRDGLADTSKTTVNLERATTDKRSKDGFTTQAVAMHKVQILDPATGTGTFLAEIIKHIHKQFVGQEGVWSNYVEQHLIPRLNGFEILMASYAMAHLKLDLLLAETGYKPSVEQRFRIFLTNSLEEHHPATGTLFASWLSQEANEANYIKRDTPVMVVLGNPPYSVSSSNKSKWIETLIADYKKELNEKNIQPLSDDYIKFIRFGQHFIDKNEEGVLAFISNNSFIDGLIHRQMRKHLLESFDKIYILDLHGNSKKKEISPDGSVDQNVFDIMQGVSINIFIKTGKKRKGELAEVFHFDLFGKREFKYDFLYSASYKDIEWSILEKQEPSYYFIKKVFNNEILYNKGFLLSKLFMKNSLGVEFGAKQYFINDSKEFIVDFIANNILNQEIDNNEIIKRFNIKTTTGWRFEQLRKSEIKKGFSFSKIKKCLCAPFDSKFTYHCHLLRRPQIDTLAHLYNPENIAIVALRQTRGVDRGCYFVSNEIFSKDVISILDRATGFPLYLYPESDKQITTDGKQLRTPNLNRELVDRFATAIGVTFTPEKEETAGTFAPIDLLDYIYAVLHSPAYREHYKEFLKIDFPRVPYPKSQETFWQLVALGSELRQLHLLEHPNVERRCTSYPISGDNVVCKLTYREGKVYINETQYFDGVPLAAWEFYIGGYQPAQKWLKDRKNRELTFEDVRHYQRIIVALTETARIMREIDEVGVE